MNQTSSVITGNNKLLVAVLCLALVSFGLVCKSQWKRSYHAGDGEGVRLLLESLAPLNEDSPASDADARFANGDTRFVGYNCGPWGPCFPGIPHANWSSIWEAESYWMIFGTSDALESNYHGDLVKRAETYAEGFNIRMKQLTPERDDLKLPSEKKQPFHQE